jgi:N-acetylmuramoyl-L-alanine amidase
MRRIDLIVVHCTATREDQRLTESMLEERHRERGFNGCGYHFYVRRDGLIVSMRALERAGAHARGYNAHSVGIAYEGGLDRDGNPKDTLTSWQHHSLRVLVKALLIDYPGSRVVGHRDLSPDMDEDGRISPKEWMKQCPCFDVKALLKD